MQSKNNIIKKKIVKVKFVYRIKRLFRLFRNTTLMLFNKSSNEIMLNVSMTLNGNKVEHSNIGDDINYYLVKELSGKKVINYWDVFHLKNKPNVMCIGSIVDWLTNSKSVIWGSGAKYGGDYMLPAKPHKVLAVRGPLTRQYLLSKGVDCPEIYGDPALLLPLIYSPSNPTKKRYRVGFILHFNDLSNENVSELIKYNDDVKLIDIKYYNVWHDIINDIIDCELILSSSLHGLILSDAYKIPNIWIKFSDKTFEGFFKYLDYFASVGRNTKSPLQITSNLNLNDLSQYKSEYTDIQFNADKLLSVCPFINYKHYKDTNKFHS